MEAPFFCPSQCLLPNARRRIVFPKRTAVTSWGPLSRALRLLQRCPVCATLAVLQQKHRESVNHPSSLRSRLDDLFFLFFNSFLINSRVPHHFYSAEVMAEVLVRPARWLTFLVPQKEKVSFVSAGEAPCCLTWNRRKNQ